MILELPRNVGVEGIEHRHVDAAGTWIPANRQGAEPLAEPVGKRSAEIGLGTHDLEGRKLGASKLAIDEIEQLGAFRCQRRRKIRAS